MWLVGVAVRRYNYRYPHNNYYFSLLHFSLVLALFLAAASLLLCSFLYVFAFLFMLFLCNIANVAQRTFEIVQKSRSREYNELYRQE